MIRKIGLSLNGRLYQRFLKQLNLFNYLSLTKWPVLDKLLFVHKILNLKWLPKLLVIFKICAIKYIENKRETRTSFTLVIKKLGLLY